MAGMSGTALATDRRVLRERAVRSGRCGRGDVPRPRASEPTASIVDVTARYSELVLSFPTMPTTVSSYALAASAGDCWPVITDSIATWMPLEIFE